MLIRAGIAALLISAAMPLQAAPDAVVKGVQLPAWIIRAGKIQPVQIEQLKLWAAETEIPDGQGALRRGGLWKLNLAKYANQIEALSLYDSLRRESYPAHIQKQPREESPGYLVRIAGFPSVLEANLFEELETLFREYGAQHVDLLIGVTPTVNLEWVQKIHRDMQIRGYSIEAVTQTILRRMYDYVHFITPQFSRTHVNFQRVPTAKMEFAMQLVMTPLVQDLVGESRKPTSAPKPHLPSFPECRFSKV